MSICLVALVVFAVLGIFSAKYRRWAKDAFGCVTRRLTFRPCQADLNRRIRAKLMVKFMKKSPALARLVKNHFEAISWAFTILLFVSLFFTASGFYNLAVYGSCDPHSEICIFNPDIGVICGSEHCAEEGCDCDVGGVSNCTEENNFTACEGDCECLEDICG